MIIVKGYRAFDDVYEKESDALASLKGWEHKERMYEMFCLLDSDAQEYWTAYRSVPVTDVNWMHEDRQVVEQELLDMSEESI